MRRGYVHLFEDEHDFARQQAMLKDAGCEELLVEREVGERARLRLDEYLYNMGAGDELVVLRLDVFGRSTGKLVMIFDGLIRKGITIVGLEPRPVIIGPEKSDPAKALLEALVEHEMSLLERRYPAGPRSSRSRARKILLPAQVEDALRGFQAGESLASIAARLDVGREVVDRALSGRRKRGENRGPGGMIRSRRTVLTQERPFEVLRTAPGRREEESE